MDSHTAAERVVPQTTQCLDKTLDSCFSYGERVPCLFRLMEGSSHLNPVVDHEALARIVTMSEWDEHFGRESAHGEEVHSPKRTEFNSTREDPELAQLLSKYSSEQIMTILSKDISKGVAQPAATTSSKFQTPPQVSGMSLKFLQPLRV